MDHDLHKKINKLETQLNQSADQSQVEAKIEKKFGEVRKLTQEAIKNVELRVASE